MMEYYRFFVDVWRFFKRYYQSAEDKDDWWDEMIEAAGKLSGQYNNKPLAIAFMSEIINELEREVRYAGTNNLV